MSYPKWVYDQKIDVTLENKRQYEKMVEKWYEKALEIYPDWYEIGLVEKSKLIKEINQIMGYTLS